MKRPTLAVGVYLLVVFISGIIVGALGHRLYSSSTVSAARPRSPEEYRQRYVSELRTRLGLNDAQVTELQSILDQTRARFHELWEKGQPDRKAIQDEQVDRINAILTEAQRAEYAKFRAERDKRRSRPPGR